LELSYLYYLINNKIEYESGELQKHGIPYSIDLVDRIYYPDFILVKTGEVIEIKPKKLINTELNKAKFDAASKLHSEKFKVLTEENLEPITKTTVQDLIKSGNLVFLNKVKIKMKNGY